MFIAGLAVLLVVLALTPVSSSFASQLPFAGEGIASKVVYLIYIGILSALSLGLFFLFALLLKCFRKEDIILMRKVLKKAMIPDSAIGLLEQFASYGVKK
jgi:hypothetical protein